MTEFCFSHEDMKKKVWELNTISRRLRLQSVASTETVPIIKSKTSEVILISKS
jgi:hypothetical protein